MTVGDISGYSRPHKIIFYSDRFKVTARHHDDGSVTTTLKPHRAPQPRQEDDTFNQSQSWKRWLGRLILAGVYLWMIWSLESFVGRHSEPFEWRATVLRIAGLEMLVILAMAILAVIQRRYVSRWHGAEHMANRAYRQTGRTDLKTISQQSPISELCGGRYVLPLLITPLCITPIMFRTIPADTVGALVRIWCGLMLLLGVLFLIALIEVQPGWHGVKIAVRFSLWLQRHVTTHPPGDAELRTAQQGIEALIAAHERAGDEAQS